MFIVKWCGVASYFASVGWWKRTDLIVSLTGKCQKWFVELFGAADCRQYNM